MNYKQMSSGEKIYYKQCRLKNTNMLLLYTFLIMIIIVPSSCPASTHRMLKSREKRVTGRLMDNSLWTQVTLKGMYSGMCFFFWSRDRRTHQLLAPQTL